MVFIMGTIMRSISHWERLSSAVIPFTCLWIISIIATPMEGCSNQSKDLQNKDEINYISFSHDGKKILFDRRKDKGPYLINVYDLKTGELRAYQPPPDERWSMARYSFDGNHIVFSIYPMEGKNLKLDKMQIAIMEPDGKNLRRLTNTEGPKIFPSFYHSGDKVIFAKAGKIRESGRTPAADFDFYEVDIETGNENRLTWFKLFSVSAPYLFPDDETIIFSTFGPPGMAFQTRKNVKDYIYIAKKGGVNLPRPLIFYELEETDPLINFEAGAQSPLLSINGEHIYFKGWARKPGGKGGEGMQLYQYSVDGKHHRLTYITPPASIFSAALSPDEQYLAVVTMSGGSKIIMLCNIEDGTSRTINLPEGPSRIINN